MTVQFKTTGVPLFKSSGVVAMDSDCCCSCFICAPSTFAIYDTVTFAVSGSACALTNGSSNHFNANWCRDVSSGGPLTIGSNFFPKCPLGTGAYFFIYDPWVNDVEVWEIIGLSNVLLETLTGVCPPNDYVALTVAGFTLTISFS